MLNIVLFGPPGAGKGTQSEKIIEKYKLKHLSTGDILRSEIAEKTPLGIKAKQCTDKGELVPDEVVISMISNVIEKNRNVPGFIFDGFPRTVNQAAVLDDILAKMNMKIDLMLSLEVDEPELIARLLNRGKKSNRPDDQDESIVQKRLNVYRESTEPVKHYYINKKKHMGVCGMKTEDEVFVQLEEILDKFITK